MNLNKLFMYNSLIGMCLAHQLAGLCTKNHLQVSPKYSGFFVNHGNRLAKHSAILPRDFLWADRFYSFKTHKVLGVERQNPLHAMHTHGRDKARIVYLWPVIEASE